MNCAACGRIVTRPEYMGGEPYGSTCFSRIAPMRRAAASVQAGGRRRRAPAVTSPAIEQRDLFAEDLAYAQRVDTLLGSISLEMPNG